MVGDAYSFIDPVFSSGVYLAMKSAFLGAEVVTACLHKPVAEAERALRQFDSQVRGALDRFSWFIYRVNTPAIRDLFMRPGNPFRMREAVLSLLSGDVYGSSPIHSRLALFKCVFYIKGFLIRHAPRFTARPRARSEAS
jgi:flavin-dependent dehydrogenase